MWLDVAKKEVRSAFREKLFIVMFCILWGLLLVAGTGSYIHYRHTHTEREKAAANFREQWEDQRRNPHGAAHYGTYLFKPLHLLSMLDPGLNNYTGATYRVEAHKQGTMNYSDAQDSDAYMRFGALTTGLIFQLLVPLLIIFLAFSAVTKEREDGTFKMLLAQGMQSGTLLWGKVWGHYLLVLALILPVVLLFVLLLVLSGSFLLLISRFGCFVMIYLVYFLIITMLSIVVSAISRHSRTALLSLMLLWVLLGVLLPRAAFGIADKQHPLPSAAAIDKNITDGYAKGMNADGTLAARRKAFMQQTLQKYHVDSIEQLPVNYSGLAMQNDEDYKSAVFRHYLKQMRMVMDRQQAQVETIGLADPFIAVKELSMSVAGNDLAHHDLFFDSAQAYRDWFIRELNKDLALHGKGGEDAHYRAEPDFFAKMARFHYELPSVAWIVRVHWLSCLSLVIWLLIAAALVFLISKRPIFL